MAPKDKAARREEKKRQETIAANIAKYSYFKLLVETNPDLAGFFEDIKKVIEASPTGTITQDEFNNLTRGYEWFSRYDSDQQEAEIAKALDRQNNTNLYEESIKEKKTNIAYTARQKGIELDDDTLTELAELARFNDWSAVEIDNAIGQEVVDLISAGGTAVGEAGEVQTSLQQWAASNGLNLTNAEVARYVESGAFGGQDLESIKQDIRKTYLAGAYPAWSDRIAEGADPADIAAPYRKRIASLLEISEDQIGFDDQLLQRGLQSVGPDGKPRVMPLFEFEQEIRKDPRWEFTDNAYDVYSRVGENLLRTFGFR